eukprot:TRINITY_DN67378_c0_g1_i1.p1 TRINITY_DN67378_c0_g1~~TRINITY_DN67378_c0_g1_i1.p1  ORF type:complete len:302 (+),score=43.86 TRINITY_DN67378_c0_g1_i1:69-974(+)
METRGSKRLRRSYGASLGVQLVAFAICITGLSWLSPPDWAFAVGTRSRQSRQGQFFQCVIIGGREESPVILKATRRQLATGGAVALASALAGLLPGEAQARDKQVDIYFGSGNFWRLQHEFVMKEALALGRRQGDLSALAGYAGGKKTGPRDQVCLPNAIGPWPNHKDLGHAQVVRVSLPSSKLKDFVEFFGTQISKRKRFDVGSNFRNVIGLRKGLKSEYIPVIQEALGDKIKLVEGKGNEPDNYLKDTVYVYDSKAFPYRTAEISNQFHDDLPEMYGNDYRSISKELENLGIILMNGCP